MDQAAQKTLIRKQLRQQRSELQPDFCQSASKHISAQLLQCSFIQNAQHLAYYWPAQNECSPVPLIQQLNSTQTYLPVINTHTNELEFYAHRLNEALTPNQFNIPEPLTEGKTPFELENLDVVLVPLLGFDLKGNRLGMGGGYYDRSFAFLKRLPGSSSKTKLIGLAYEFQKLDQAPEEAWDVPLDGVVTEDGFYSFS